MPDLSTLPFTPIICLSASEAVDVQPRTGFTYLQGCADDEETWAKGLTAAALWMYSDVLKAAGKDTCVDKVAAAVRLFRAAQHQSESAPEACDGMAGGQVKSEPGDNAGTAAGSPALAALAAGRMIRQGGRAVPFGAAIYAGGADACNFIAGTTLAVGSRRAGR